jgi:hypothetical protein
MNREIALLVAEFLIRLAILIVVPLVYRLLKKHNLEKAVKEAVWAAEQLLKKNDPTGEKRKKFVEEYILSKFKISKEELDVLIEAAVRQLNIIQKQTGQA